MKKQLLSLAIIAAMGSSYSVNAEPALTQVWKYQSEVLNDGWDGTAPNWSSPDAIKSKPCTRFATGHDGKLYTINMMTMSIAEITADGFKDVYKLPSLEGRVINGNPDYYGTAISVDDAGNFLVGHLFTKAESSTVWSVFSPATGKIKHFDLGIPEGMQIARMDCVGRVVGDLTKDAYFYIAPKNGLEPLATNQVVRMVHVQGDGDVDNVTMTSTFSQQVYLGAQHNQNVAQPKYATVAETVANPYLDDTFYLSSCSGNGQWSRAYTTFTNNAIDWAWQSAMQKNIFAATNGFDTFVLGGQKYFVRNYIPNDDYSTNPNTMDIAVLDANGEIVAIWNNPDYVSTAGYSSITAQVIDDSNAYIYVYNSTGSPKPGMGAAAVLYFSTEGSTDVSEGSQVNPYKISTPADLCDMHNKIVDGKKVWFVMENDIDMAGVKDYVPAIGSDGATYFGEFEFDGQNHVIKNFAPDANYSYMSIFGVIRGNVKNLGVEDCEIVSNSLGAGVLGGYGSQGGINCVIDNVWATGSVTCATAYAGGLVGTNGNNLTITNSYFKGDVIAKFAGGLVGRARAGITIKNSYAAGEVAGSTNAGGIAGTDKEGLNIALENVIAWNTSVASATAAAVTTLVYDAAKVQVWDGMTVNGAAVTGGVPAATLVATATSWDAYNKNLKDGYPALAWQDVKGPLGSENNPYVIATPADLCDMHNKIVAGQKVWFVLANDIDMAGVKDYVPVIGSDGATYVGEFEFDGQNHVIKNFAPDANYSYMSIFGVIRGNVKNLGVEDCEIVSNSLGAGVLGGYGSQGGIDCVIDNVWATGSVTCATAYAGGLVGTNGNNLTITNSYFKGDVIAKFAGGLVGRARAGITIKNSYAAGEVAGSTNAGGIAGTDKEGLNIALENVIAWNTSVASATAAAVTTLVYDAAKVQVWDGMTVNGAAVTGGVPAATLAATATSWDAYNSRLDNGYPALAWQEITGSEAKPYKISTPADLCDMHNKIVAGQKVWFVLENDIDMAGVKDYVPVIGSDGATYVGEFEFDGQNHVIKNFAPDANYSYMSIFGVIRGNVKNLGVENCDVKSTSLGAGALGGYGSQGGIDCVIDNVWVTGKVNGEGVYAGGLVGTNGNNLTITNSYFNGEVNGKYAGGLVGRARAGITIKNSYAAGKVTGTDNAGGIAGTDKADLTVALDNVIAWNSSVSAAAAAAVTTLNYEAANVKVWDGMTVNNVAVEGGMSTIDLQIASAGWKAYKNLLNGYPALAWQNATEDVPFPGTEANPYKVATSADLVGLAAAVNRDGFYVEFTEDIDMTNVAFTPIDAKKTLYIDGKNHVVSNLSVTAAKAAMFLDFKGSIKNLGIENAKMEATGWGTAGTFVAYALNEAVIENCYATGSVSGFYAGGLVAGVQSAGKLTIRNSYAKVDATSPNGWAGGLVGPTNEYGTLIVENCYASGRIDGFANGGGVVAGANTNYTNACNVTLTNVVAWNSEVVKGDAVVPAASVLNAVVTDALVWNEMIVNGAPVEGGKSTYDLQVVVTGWEAYNDKLANGMPVLAWQEANEDVIDPNPLGSENNPYQIATPADLCDMHNKIVADKKVWFVLANDIDMADVKDYVPAIGSDGATYAGEFEFDGQYHVIKNFAPDANYSYMSIFGVIRGNVKNLGVENCDVKSTSLGAGALGGYGSQGGIDCVIDNVWVTGKVNGEGVYAGGLVGTNGNNLTITNSYFNGEVNGKYAGGLVGRARAGITIKNCYAAGKVTGTDNAGGIAGTDKTGLTMTLEDVIAWNSSVSATEAAAVTTLGYDANPVQVWVDMKVNNVAVENGVSTYTLQKAATAWEAYNDKLANGMPVLAWQEATEEVKDPNEGVEYIGADDAVAPVYYNLQGVEVENPAPGLYIVKRGNKVTKEVVR